jgi:diguanylate cyclase (GGDEF)-like protein
MANTTQDLKTDTTLDELRTAAPRDEREFALAIGFAWWLSSIVVLLIGSYALPPVMEHGLDYWRIGGLIVSIALAVSYITWMKRLPPPAAYRAIFGATLVAGLMNLPLMLAAPATVAALTINLLLGVIYAAYFLSGRQTMVVTALATLYAIVPSIVHESGIDQRMTSRLTVWLPIVWLIALAIHLQNHERRRAVASAEHQALTDPLTGIANLRAMRRRVADVLELSHDPGRVAVLLLIDLDGLKTVNTRHGHTAGDRVLQNVAHSLARSARPNELVARIGDDMFAVLIEDVAVGDVAAAMLRYRAMATDAATDVSVPDVRLNAHVGVAVYPDDGIAFEQLVTAADRSLYAEKYGRAVVRQPVAAKESDDLRYSAAAPRAAIEAPAAWEPDAESPMFLGRPLHATSATVGWYLATLLVLLSMAMPDADHSQLSIALPLVLCLLIPATLNFFLMPPISSARYLFDELFTLGMIALIAYLTGGSQSPAWALVFMFLIHDGWFMSARQLAPRFLTIVLVILAPLVYEDIGSGVQRTATVTTLYMGVYVAFAQTLVMGLNRTYMIRAQNVARRLAALDPLTGLPNRRSFERALNTRLDELRYQNSDALAVVMIDLDGLKRVHTESGHGKGDVLLCRIAEALRGAAGDTDLVARISADEFVAMLSTSDENAVHEFAERLVQSVDSSVAGTLDTTGATVTACAGFSLYPTHGNTFDELVSAAELAVLTVKAGGRPSRVSNVVIGL